MKTDLRLIQEQQPLIHNITNYVAMNFVANSLLAIGASPIMARAKEEVEEISSKSNALALNLGVPESTTAHSMILAGEAAMKKRIPIVFDVVGVGATRFRMDIASQIILRCHPTVIKGNASEIQALYSHQIGMLGVDSHQETYEVEEQAKKLAKQGYCNGMYCHRNHWSIPCCELRPSGSIFSCHESHGNCRRKGSFPD